MGTIRTLSINFHHFKNDIYSDIIKLYNLARSIHSRIHTWNSMRLVILSNSYKNSELLRPSKHYKISRSILSCWSNCFYIKCNKNCVSSSYYFGIKRPFQPCSARFDFSCNCLYCFWVYISIEFLRNASADKWIKW